jgi:hypothetical protein
MAAYPNEPPRLHSPGAMFWMPPYSGLPGDPTDDGHPHALIVPAEPENTCTLVYGSTSGAEEAEGCQRHVVKPQKAGVRRNGLTRTTRFYTGILSLRAYEDLPPVRSAWVGGELPGLRDKLRLSLGVGTGCVGEADHNPASWRGRLVRLAPFAALNIGSELGVIVTEPHYSAAKCYQTVVPVIDGTGATAVVEPALRIASPPWIKLVGKEATDAVLLVPSSASMRHTGKYIVDVDTRAVLSRDATRRLDEQLCRWFQLALLK